MVNNKWRAIVIGLIVLVLFVGIFGGDTEEDTSSNSDTQTTEKLTKKEEPKKEKEEDKMVALGKSAKAGEFEYSFKNVQTTKELNDGAGWSEKADGEFVYLDVTIKNVGDEANLFSEGSIKLVCDGKKYETSANASTYFAGKEEELFIGEINPDVSKTGKVGFDVPSKVAHNKNAYLEVDNGFDEPIKFKLYK